jgi:hypothetical protein
MMAYALNRTVLQTGALFLDEQEAYSGVRKMADKVAGDIGKVFGVRPGFAKEIRLLSAFPVLFGTDGKSPALDELDRLGRIRLDDIRGKREVFLMQVIDAPEGWNGVNKVLVIAGSDKRGTIYGLFRLSEMLGVSPLVNWIGIQPRKLEEFVLEDGFKFVSKEPSVRYRGFFINDEWPAFGTWCNHRFGGFNAAMYEHVFELLLRLKGNYLWPAMWSARFYDDGPGLANAELADELGVVIGSSHHEPCLRQGEEYRYLRGPDSIYGDAWNFRTNEAGITRFWEDGLKRSGKFENVITVGMRGEQDTAIMGKEATLEDNINLLRDVLRTQNRLIREHVNPDLRQVPRMLALYKEVEPFFYGDDETPGLIGSEELDGVTLLFCDDNFGNLRTLPTEDMQGHNGGYGMYYHFDYHGWPISFEWINSSHLPKVWEQMTMAYDFGIRELWVVNVGDIATQEFPLSYFLDLAYDFDRWGTKAINRTDEYVKQWIRLHFGASCGERELDAIRQLLDGYTKIAHRRRPEAMNADVYHPVHYRETDLLLAEIDRLTEIAEDLYRNMPNDALPAFIALVYYPAMGNLNLQKMHLLAGKNHYLAKLNCMEANLLAEQIKACLARDAELIEQYHAVDNGRWFGMGLSEHIGFTQWNEEECRYPVIMNALPARKPRLLVAIDGTSRWSEGSSWHVHRLDLTDFRRPDVTEASFTIHTLSDLESAYEIVCETPWLACSSLRGTLDGVTKASETVTVTIDRNRMNGETKGQIIVKLPNGTVTIDVDATLPDVTGLPDMTFVATDGYVSIEAAHFAAKGDVPPNGDGDPEAAGFRVIDGYGKTLSAVKVFPSTRHFAPGPDAPYVEYRFAVPAAGEYEAELFMQPSNPATKDNRLLYGIRANDGDIAVVNAVSPNFRVGDHSEEWGNGVLDNIRRQRTAITCQGGLNTLRVYAYSPGFVMEKLVIHPAGQNPAESYLGPPPSYCIRK